MSHIPQNPFIACFSIFWTNQIARVEVTRVLLYSSLYQTQFVESDRFYMLYISHPGTAGQGHSREQLGRVLASWRHYPSFPAILQMYNQVCVNCYFMLDTEGKAGSWRSGFSGCFWWNRMSPAGGGICVVDWDCWVSIVDWFYWKHKVSASRLALLACGKILLQKFVTQA